MFEFISFYINFYSISIIKHNEKHNTYTTYFSQKDKNQENEIGPSHL